jgi:hypothetical protein
MSQLDEVSNIANPTFDAELAISMTVNAKLPKTPQRQSLTAGASDVAVDSLDNKIPLEERESDGQYPPNLPVKWRTTVEVSRCRSAKGSPGEQEPAAQKVSAAKCVRIRPNSGFGPARSAAQKGRTAAEAFEWTAVWLCFEQILWRGEVADCARPYLESAGGRASFARGESVSPPFYSYGLHVYGSVQR